jgi:hypothetical protein
MTLSSNLTSQRSFRAEQADFSESVRSCERIGLRSEESLFDVSARPVHSTAASARLSSELCALCELRALCVNDCSRFFPTTHYSLPTTHWPHP